MHLFVFYFGIMADVTPPVGLASYAAAAISGADPNRTGWQATWYSFRTALLPFVFIFNPQILFIGVSTWFEVVMVCLSATVASLLFAAATMLWFRTKCTWFDVALLLLATFLFFRPDYVIDQFYPKYVAAPPDRHLRNRRRAATRRMARRVDRGAIDRRRRRQEDGRDPHGRGQGRAREDP